MAPDRKTIKLAEDIERLEEIRDEIRALADEALGIFEDHDERSFRSYGYAHIIGALSSDHDLLGGSLITLQDCINDIRAKG